MFGIKPRFIVGGEPVFSPAIIFGHRYGSFSDYGSRLTEYQRYDTFGAYYSFKVIIQHLRFDKNDSVLLPAYLCPSIIIPFRKAGVRYDFYKMKEGLVPDQEDIGNKSSRTTRAVLFVDYFGVPQKRELTPILEELKERKIATIQDTVQSWLNNESDLYADYCVNSVRKYTPFEASVLLARQSLSIKGSYRSMNRFIRNKRWGQVLRFYHINCGLFSPDTFLKHIEISNSEYHQEGIAMMPPLNRWLLDRLDFKSLGEQRKTVYHLLLNSLSPRTIISADIGNAVPLGLAVYLSDRDKKKRDLHSRSIHCPLHWRLSDEIDRGEHEFCWDLEQHALTLPVCVPDTSINEYISNLYEVLA